MNIFITGANRGLGFATTMALIKEGHHVFACHRQNHTPPHLQHPNITPIYFDATQALSKEASEAILLCEALINNAGWGADLEILKDSTETIPHHIFQQAIEINALAPLKLIQAILPSLKQNGFGRIVNVSSIRGSLHDDVGGRHSPAYNISKATLNAITVNVAKELTAYPDILINSVCPGWCQTDMGGPDATDSPELGAKKIIELIHLPKNGPSGMFYIDHQPTLF